MQIVPCDCHTLDAWTALRRELWPETSVADHALEAREALEDPGQAVAFLAQDASGAPAGFAEAALRHDYVNGCATSPVAFLEGIYVRPAFRKQGVARLLIEAVETWARDLGCAELASDAELHNQISHIMHLAAGFEETERVVYYRKPLGPRR